MFHNPKLENQSWRYGKQTIKLFFSLNVILFLLRRFFYLISNIFNAQLWTFPLGDFFIRNGKTIVLVILFSWCISIIEIQTIKLASQKRTDWSDMIRVNSLKFVYRKHKEKKRKIRVNIYNFSSFGIVLQ